jgi:hypothetical protein
MQSAIDHSHSFGYGDGKQVASCCVSIVYTLLEINEALTRRRKYEQNGKQRVSVYGSNETFVTFLVAVTPVDLRLLFFCVIQMLSYSHHHLLSIV